MVWTALILDPSLSSGQASSRRAFPQPARSSQETRIQTVGDRLRRARRGVRRLSRHHHRLDRRRHVVGDFDDLQALSAAAAGCRAIYHICPNVSRDEFKYACAVAGAAKAQGVERFVFHSVLHPQIEAMPHHWEKMRAEAMLFDAGFELTILQPTAYMQNILASWPSITDSSHFQIAKLLWNAPPPSYCQAPVTVGIHSAACICAAPLRLRVKP